MDSLPENEPVLCIPRVYPNISEGRIRHIFDELNLGSIDHIDFVKKENDQGQSFNMVFIHFRYWKNNKNANDARERLLEGKQIKVIYDEPWFWKISAYRQPTKKSINRRNKDHKRPTLEIDFQDSDDDKLRQPSRTYGKYSNKPYRKGNYQVRKTNYKRTNLTERSENHRYDEHSHSEEHSEDKDEVQEEFGFHKYQEEKDQKIIQNNDLDYGALPIKPKIKKNTLKYVPRQVREKKVQDEDHTNSSTKLEETQTAVEN